MEEIREPHTHAETRARSGIGNWIKSDSALRAADLLAGGIAIGVVFWWLQYSTRAICCGDFDGYYHIKWARMLWDNMRAGHFPPAFPWLPLTTLNAHDYVDHHLLFHIILYRIINSEYARDDLHRKVMPEEYPPKRRSEIRRSFHSKLQVVTKTHKLPGIVSSTLNTLHGYRNATYHRDKHNPAVLPILARIALVATADLLARTAAGFGNRGIGGGDSVEWLQQYGLGDSPIWFETVARSDRTLKWYEFRRERPDLESTLISARLWPVTQGSTNNSHHSSSPLTALMLKWSGQQRCKQTSLAVNRATT